MRRVLALALILASCAQRVHPPTWAETIERTEVQRVPQTKVLPSAARLEVTSTSDMALTLHATQVQRCEDFELVTFDQVEVRTPERSAKVLEEMRRERFWGPIFLVGSGLAAGVATTAYLQEAIEQKQALGVLSVSAAPLGLGMMWTARGHGRPLIPERKPVGPITLATKPTLRDCGAVPMTGAEVVFGETPLGVVDVAGEVPLDLKHMDLDLLERLKGRGALTCGGEAVPTPPELTAGASTAWCSRTAATRERAFVDYERALRRWQNARVVCADGWRGSKCYCDNATSGCCSSHGGVAGCQLEQPVKPGRSSCE